MSERLPLATYGCFFRYDHQLFRPSTAGTLQSISGDYVSSLARTNDCVKASLMLTVPHLINPCPPLSPKKRPSIFLVVQNLVRSKKEAKAISVQQNSEKTSGNMFIPTSCPVGDKLSASPSDIHPSLPEASFCVILRDPPTLNDRLALKVPGSNAISARHRLPAVELPIPPRLRVPTPPRPLSPRRTPSMVTRPRPVLPVLLLMPPLGRPRNGYEMAR